MTTDLTTGRVTKVILVFSLPLLLWLTPYRKVARAAFYDARQAMPEPNTQDLPPL